MLSYKNARSRVAGAIIGTSALLGGCQYSGLNYGEHVKGGLNQLVDNPVQYRDEAVYLGKANKPLQTILVNSDSSVDGKVAVFSEGNSVFFKANPAKEGHVLINYSFVYTDGTKDNGVKVVYAKPESRLTQQLRHGREDESRLHVLIDGIYVDLRQGNEGKRLMVKPGDRLYINRDFAIVPIAYADKTLLKADANDDAVQSFERAGKALTGQELLFVRTGEKGELIVEKVEGNSLIPRYDAVLAGVLKGTTNSLESLVTSVAPNDDFARVNTSVFNVTDAALTGARRFAPLAGTEIWPVITPLDDNFKLVLPVVNYVANSNNGEVSSPGTTYFTDRREGAASKAINVVISIAGNVYTGYILSDIGSISSVGGTGLPGPQPPQPPF
jgi:hypothetical protein